MNIVPNNIATGFVKNVATIFLTIWFDGEKTRTQVHDLNHISLVEVNQAIKAWSF